MIATADHEPTAWSSNSRAMQRDRVVAARSRTIVCLRCSPTSLTVVVDTYTVNRGNAMPVTKLTGIFGLSLSGGSRLAAGPRYGRRRSGTRQR